MLPTFAKRSLFVSNPSTATSARAARKSARAWCCIVRAKERAVETTTGPGAGRDSARRMRRRRRTQSRKGPRPVDRRQQADGRGRFCSCAVVDHCQGMSEVAGYSLAVATNLCKAQSFRERRIVRPLPPGSREGVALDRADDSALSVAMTGRARRRSSAMR